VDTVLGWSAFWIVLIAFGLASTVAMTVFLVRRLWRHGARGIWLVLATIVIGYAALLGLWLIFDISWVAFGAVVSVRQLLGTGESRQGYVNRDVSG
jgi:uncharacterized membrane protein YhaH (DUF805 family)